MARPRVTVAVVTLNAAADLPGTLRSIRRQSWAEKEVLVVDGGSTDGTLDIVQEPGSGVDRWVTGKDSGPYDAMNKAAALGTGDYIIFMNAGDWFADPQAIEHAFRHAPPEADFVFGHHYYRLRDGSLVLHKAADFDETWARLRAGDVSFRWLSGIPCHQATFTRRVMLVEHGYNLALRITADHDFMYRMRATGAHFHHANTIVAVYSQGGMSSMQEALCFHEWWHLACEYGDPGRATRFFQENLGPSVIEHPARVGAVVEAVRASQLFFEDWYRTQYMGSSKADPVEHYMYLGWKQGFWPNPFFDPVHYLEQSRDAREAGVNPLDHYARQGMAECRPTYDWDNGGRSLSAFRALFDPRKEGLDILIRRIARLPPEDLSRILGPYTKRPRRAAEGDSEGRRVDGSWSATEGLSEFVEGPYPQFGLEHSFRWSVGPVTTIRIFSAQEGLRRASVVVRNALAGQRLTFEAGGRLLLDAALPVASLATPITLEFDLQAQAGEQDVEIRPSRLAPPDSSGREVSFILERIHLDDARQAAPQVDLLDDDGALVGIAAPDHPQVPGERPATGDADIRVLWDKCAGIGGAEGPAPHLGLRDKFRWITARRCSLVVEAAAVRDATLRLDYRCAIPGQRAILRANDEPPRFVDIPSAPLSEGFSLDVPIRLKAGRNSVEMLLSECIPEEGGARELALLVERLSIRS